jgi:hypothetical protein
MKRNGNKMAVFTVLQAKWKVDVDSVCHPGGPKEMRIKKGV